MNEVDLRAEYNNCSTPTEQTEFLRKMKSPEFNEDKMMSVFGITRQRVNQVWKSTSHGPSHLVLSPAEVNALNTFFKSADNLADAKRLYSKYQELCRVSISDLGGCDKVTDACISSLGHGCGELQRINLRSCSL